MPTRLPNPRLAKIHYSYAVEDIARLFGMHSNTVRQWIKQGLPMCDERRPILILGSDLRDFLQTKRTKNKRPLKPHEIYCMRCRAPRSPWGNLADYIAQTPTSGMLTGLCCECEAVMYRRISLAGLAQISGVLHVTHTKAHSRIGESLQPSVNSDFVTGE